VDLVNEKEKVEPTKPVSKEEIGKISESKDKAPSIMPVTLTPNECVHSEVTKHESQQLEILTKINTTNNVVKEAINKSELDEIKIIKEDVNKSELFDDNKEKITKQNDKPEEKSIINQSVNSDEDEEVEVKPKIRKPKEQKKEQENVDSEDEEIEISTTKAKKSIKPKLKKDESSEDEEITTARKKYPKKK